MKPFWKQTTAQGSAVFGHDSSYFERRNNSFYGKNCGENLGSFCTWILRQATRRNLTLIPLSSRSGSFNGFVWISNLVGEALKSSFCFLFSKQNVTIRRKRRRWARKFLASGPWIHPTNDTHDGTELKKLIPAWGA